MEAIVTFYHEKVNDVSANLLHVFRNFIVILAKIEFLSLIFRHF